MSEAERLASELDLMQVKVSSLGYNAAAELRRLAAEVERLSKLLALQKTSYDRERDADQAEVEALRAEAARLSTLWRLTEDGDLYLYRVEILDSYGNTETSQFADIAELQDYLDKRAARPGKEAP